jgi:hypothetical protein
MHFGSSAPAAFLLSFSAKFWPDIGPQMTVMRQGVCSVLGPDRVHPLRYLSALLVSIVFISMVHAQGRQQPIRLCVSMLKNSSQEVVNPTWQRDELIKAFERINKSKDVKKGKAAAIQAIPLASTGEPDTNVRDKGCGFVLHSNLVEVLRLGEPRISVPRQAQSR